MPANALKHAEHLVLPVKERAALDRLGARKWRLRNFDATGLRAFRKAYPDAEAMVVAHDVRGREARREAGTSVTLVDLPGLVSVLSQATSNRSPHS